MENYPLWTPPPLPHSRTTCSVQHHLYHTAKLPALCNTTFTTQQNSLFCASSATAPFLHSMTTHSEQHLFHTTGLPTLNNTTHIAQKNYLLWLNKNTFSTQQNCPLWTTPFPHNNTTHCKQQYLFHTTRLPTTTHFPHNKTTHTLNNITFLTQHDYPH